MEQLQFGDTIYWNCVNGLTKGELVGVVDNTTILVKTLSDKYLPLSVYTIKKVEHNDRKGNH